MDVAHDLFHADSRNILHYLHQLDDQLIPCRDHRRELGLVLASTLMRGAGLDWYEQGDVWAKVAAHRPAALPASFPTQVTDAELAAVRTLITACGNSASSPLTAAPDWAEAFQAAGAQLAALAKRGRLSRGPTLRTRPSCAVRVEPGQPLLTTPGVLLGNGRPGRVPSHPRPEARP
ncbi:hypothetical protein E1267_36605 [Nonomuraea longispora]|uniref:Thiopeptide-type bacteriocin biosynthesis domain-containing protein n=2 Tax=Nonomuraea longispora TaxID=1848320 RepID=A0A4V2XIR4_9ACTN|nr:hypothetical protein E1267_36605 [Nonomuraea longispora]